MVVRIMLMVPIYAIASLIALFSLEAAFFIDAVRDIYEVRSVFLHHICTTRLTKYVHCVAPPGIRHLLLLPSTRRLPWR